MKEYERIRKEFKWAKDKNIDNGIDNNVNDNCYDDCRSENINKSNSDDNAYNNNNGDSYNTLLMINGDRAEIKS